VSSAHLAGLRALAESLPAGTAIPVPRELLLELLEGAAAKLGTNAPNFPAASADSTVAEIASRFGRSPSTIRGWLDRGLIPGAYRFQKREWRVPAAALAAFEAAQRPENAPGKIGPPRGTSAHPVALGAWRTAS
jgi:hypothetical protein